MLQFISLLGLASASNESFRAFQNFPSNGKLHASDTDKDLVRAVVIVAIKHTDPDASRDYADQVIQKSDPYSLVYGEWFNTGFTKTYFSVGSNGEIADKYFKHGASKCQNASWTINKFGDLGKFIGSISCIETVFQTELRQVSEAEAEGNTMWRAAKDMDLPPEVKAALDGCSLNTPIYSGPPPSRPHSYYDINGEANSIKFERPRRRSDSSVSVQFWAYCHDGRMSASTDTICGAREISVLTVQQEVDGAKSNKMHPIPMSKIRTIVSKCKGDCDDELVDCVSYEAVVSVEVFKPLWIGVSVDGKETMYSNGAYDINRNGTLYPYPPMDPKYLSNYYKVPFDKKINSIKNIVGIPGFLGQYINAPDIDSFYRDMKITNANISKIEIFGKNDETKAGGEALLDVEYLSAMAPGATLQFYSTDMIEVDTLNEPFLSWLYDINDVESNDGMPIVYSISYADDEDDMPEWFTKRVNLEFLKLAGQGISILAGSGDDGTFSYRNRDLPKDNMNAMCKKSRPVFPASSPWVTAVGATQLGTSMSTKGKVSFFERGCQSNVGGDITSGGGFSNRFERLPFQEPVVQSYLDNRTFAFEFNRTGAAYPDFSVIGNNYPFRMSGETVLGSGTSGAAPIAAGIFTHLNEILLSHGKPQLGFLNPLLYRIAEFAFNDVVVGDAACAAETSACCPEGFQAAEGWDPMTGLGSPMYKVIVRYLRRFHSMHTEFLA